MIYTITAANAAVFANNNVPVVDLDSLIADGATWGDTEHLRGWIDVHRDEFNLTGVSRKLGFHDRKLYDWVVGREYRGLGDDFEKVEQWAILRGYCPFLSYENVL